MPLHPNMEWVDYLNILRRKKWLIVFAILLILFVTSIYCVVAPEYFRSSTTILVVPQRIPEGYVRSTVSMRIEDRLSTIQQQVMSRTRLATVMDELGLFQPERKTVPIEALVERMRKGIQIEVGQGGRRAEGADSFTLSFIHEDPRMAMLTASRLASLFIDENLKNREQQAVGTSEFLESQLQETKKKLEDQEERVKQYKLRFSGELPQQLQANLTNLTRLQDQLRAVTDALRSAEDRRALFGMQISSLEMQASAIEAQYTAGMKAGTGDGATRTTADPVDPVMLLAGELNAKKRQLSTMSSRYTEQYPEVRRLKDEIAQLEIRIAELEQGASGVDDPAGKIAARSAGGRDMSLVVAGPGSREREEIRRLKTQITGVDMEIRSLKSEREEIHRTITGVNAKVEKSPHREQEMVALNRDYDNLKNQYDDMLRKKLDADVSQNLEKRQKGEQFQILDPANLPKRPFTPDRPKILAIGLALAFFVGFGGALGLEWINPTLRGSSDFKHYFEYPVLGSIPAIRDEQYERRVWIRQAAVMGGVVFFSLAVMVFLVINGGKIRSILHGVRW